MAQELSSSRLKVQDDFEALDLFYANRWTDGLPVVPPTEERVRAMVEFLGRDPRDEIGVLPPGFGVATIEKIAVNAVMAGALPQYMPVILAALQAMLAEEFNLYGVQTTTGGRAPMIIVNGPYARRIGMNGKYHVFSIGNRANSTIGRAVRLAMLNIGGATPGDVDKSTLGHAGKYTYCFCENEEENPWEPFHVDRGFRKEDDVVTVWDAEAPHFTSYVPNIPENLLTLISDSLASMGNTQVYFLQAEVMVVLGPSHAAYFKEQRWTKKAIRNFVFEKARRRFGDLQKYGVVFDKRYEKWPQAHRPTGDPDQMVPIVANPEDILVLVVGGAGSHSGWVTPWTSRSVSRRIVVPPGK